MQDENSSSQRCSCLTRISNAIEHALETFFYKLGEKVGAYPARTIVIMFIVAFVCMAGLSRFRQESRPNKLWVPRNAEALDQKEWVGRIFPETARYGFLIVTPTKGENVLTPAVLKELYDLHVSIVNITARGSTFFQQHNIAWEQLCFRRNPRRCWISSILTLWEFDRDRIYGLTSHAILSELNKNNLTDPWNGGLFQASQVIGDISYDPDPSKRHTIIGAKALRLIYRIYSNETFDESSGEEVDERADDFERQVDTIGQKKHDELSSSVRTTFGLQEETSKAIQNDLTILAAGYFLIIAYVCISLGQMTRLKHKIWLSFAGVISTGLGIVVSLGLCSAFGLFYGPVHSVLPFLLLGVGVDDMFVILSSWENLDEKTHKEKSISERIGLTLKEAGVSVTVTSLTDLVAFLVGASTVLPALQSFCVFAGIGILFDLIFQVTVFTAFLAIDGSRVDARRDACLCFKLSDDYQESKCCWTWWPFQSGWFKRFVADVYAPTLMKTPVKIVVIVVAMVVFGVGTYGVTKLDRHFDFKWFLPSGSYVLDYFADEDLYFTSIGRRTAVYTGNVHYYAQTDQLDELGKNVLINEYINPSTVEYWYFDYKKWLNESALPKPNDKASFSETLRWYLNTSDGQRHQADVKFKNEDIVATRLIANHRKLVDTDDKVDAMVSLRDTAASVDLSPEKAFAYAETYINREADLVIRRELFRNIGLAMMCVFIVTLLLIANIWSSVLVLGCVVLTLVDTAGMMHFWNLTIDVVTTVVLILAIGLAVDYSAHIAHAFLIPNAKDKSNDDRAITTLRTIGTAVWNGGFSTFLAFVLLASSDSYVFMTFFKVFFLVVLFGLFHGLCLLPVVLSLIGPSPYASQSAIKTTPSVELKEKNAPNGFQNDHTATMDDKRHIMGQDRENGFTNSEERSASLAVESDIKSVGEELIV
ncbi:patched domain-containing protein 3-like [Corticium candelabrum]|uniref:patched domain-containing protein 3-like n=1 Tax=Corticium candelabrum TaxID=121492 RepID=UPI002E25F99A|nr:patched domain-containing protein 3-like [Corticium candelabrum]